MTYSMTHVAPTVARALGLRPPADGEQQEMAEIAEDLADSERVAVIGVDALGTAQLERFREQMPYLWSLCEARCVTLCSTMPSITPVNFATMVSGCDLEGHGVRSKELDFQCETLFDVLEEAGLQGAGCGRPTYSGGQLLARVAQIDGVAAVSDDAGVEEAVLRIANEDGPAFIIAQIGGTDDHFHRFGPNSARMIPKLREADWRLSNMVPELGSVGYAVMILADHGQHDSGNPEKMGTHGTDSDEDCLVPCTWLRAEDASA